MGERLNRTKQTVNNTTEALRTLTLKAQKGAKALAELSERIYTLAADTGYEMEKGADAEALDFFLAKLERALEEEDYLEADRAIHRAELCCENWVTLEELGIVDMTNQPDHKTDDST